MARLGHLHDCQGKCLEDFAAHHAFTAILQMAQTCPQIRPYKPGWLNGRSEISLSFSSIAHARPLGTRIVHYSQCRSAPRPHIILPCHDLICCLALETGSICINVEHLLLCSRIASREGFINLYSYLLNMAMDSLKRDSRYPYMHVGPSCKLNDFRSPQGSRYWSTPFRLNDSAQLAAGGE